MKLSEVGIIIAAPKAIAFTGVFNPTTIKTSDGELYYTGKLIEPVLVGCSTMREGWEDLEFDELYVRQSAALGDAWEPVNKEKFEELKKKNKLADYKEGWHIPKWVADFSQGQELPLYQDKTIAQWAREKRTGNQAEERKSMMQRIRERKAGK